MADEPLQEQDEHARERELEKELARAHAQEEKIESELEHIEQLEENLDHELQEEHHLHHKRHFFLIFIINGEDFRVKTRLDALLKQAVEQALVESGNTGRRETSEWEVRDSSGVLLEMSREIKDLGLADGSRLFLSLKVGAGGHDALRS
jgi:hypothetical protein